jgi:hypothetical protein cdiviTM7_01565
LKARNTTYEKYGKDFYKNIGRKGGSVQGTRGGFAANPALASIAGAKGGRISRRGPAKPKTVVLTDANQHQPTSINV